MKEDTYPEIDKVCRLCVKVVGESFPIFSGGEEQLSIPMRLMMLSLDVKEKDGLPKQLCSDCRYELEKFFVFRKRGQISDNKLRKHIRLLSLRKKSRVFHKSDEEEEYDDDELDFEDSIRFLKEQDELKNRNKDQWKEDYKRQQEEEVQKQLDSLSKKVKRECEATLRAEVIDTVRLELRNEVREEVRNELRSEVAAEVREALRRDLTEQCRKEQIGSLIGELEVFLSTKKGIKENIISRPSVIKEAEQTTKILLEPQQRFNLKRRRIIKDNEGSDHEQESIEGFTITTIAVEENNAYETLRPERIDDEFEAVKRSSRELDEARDFIICRDISMRKSTEVEEEQLTDEIGRVINNETYSIESEDKRITSYKIEENGEIQFCSKSKNRSVDKEIKEYNESNVMFLEIDDNMVKLVNMEDNGLYSNSKNGSETAENEESLSESNEPRTTFKQLNNGSRKKTVRMVGTNDINKDTNTSNVRTNEPQRCTETAKTFACQLCPIVFSTQNSFKRHQRSHDRVKESGIHYQCPVCKLYLSCSSALKRHVLIHTGERPFACAECGKTFVQSEILKRHMDTHTGVKNFECPDCKQRFAQKINLRTHMSKVHMEEPILYSCDLCSKHFTHASGLSRHLQTHSGITYQCEHCNRQFSDRSSIKRHITKKHGVVDKFEDSIKSVKAEK